MCDEHDTSAHGPGLSRRRLLQGMVALAAVAGLGGGPTSAAAAPLPPRASNLAGQNAYAMAMHLHASASEGAGSVGSQLAQAALNGFDVAWFTDHDWRRHRLLFRQSYSFIANEVQFGGTWNVPRIANTGSLAAGSGGTLVTSPVTATDPATGGTPGPVHNQIPKPDRVWDGSSTDDNTTYWAPDFNRAHYLQMMFGAKDSFKDFYTKQSNGRFSANGDVSNWVKLPYNEARYGQNTSCGSNVCSTVWYLIRDAINQWVADQKAAGRSNAAPC